MTTQREDTLNNKYLTIRHRLISKNFNNYVYIEDNDIIIKLKEDYINQEFI
jgi:hypothetical protein